MIIKKLNITAFGGLKDKTVIFNEGTNVIYGLNEAGKSTICAFIHAMLYGMNKPLRNDSRVDLRQKYLPWDTQIAIGSMEFSFNEKDYVIERKFGKTKRTDKCVLRNSHTWEECTDFDAENIGADILGLSEESFVKTVFMGQLATKISGKDDEILKRLSNLTLTGDEEASFGVIKKILSDAKYSIIPKATAKSIMGDLLDKKESLLKEKTEIIASNESVKDSIIENNFLKKKTDEIKKELSVLTKEKEQAREYEKFAADEKIIDSIHKLTERKVAAEKEQENIYKKILEKNDKIDSFDIDKHFASLNMLEKLEESKKIAEIQSVGTEELKEKILSLKNEYALAQKHSNSLFSVIFLFVGIIILTITFSMRFFVPQDSPYILPMALFGALCLILSTVYFIKSYKGGKTAKKLFKEISEKEESLEKMLTCTDAQKINKQIEEILNDLGAENTDEIRKRITDFGALKNETELLEKELSLIKKNISQTENDIKSSQQMLKGAKECEKTRAFEEVEEEFSQKNNELIELEKRKKELDFLIKHSNEGLRTLDVVETELSLLEPEISYYKSVYDSLETALSVMAECEEEFKSNFTPSLISHVNNILSSLSFDRYTDVRLSDDYKAMVKEPEKNTIIVAENLSGGTYDLIYVAVRLGILKAVFGEKIPLVIMDDTFLQFDDERQNRVIAYLNNEEKVFQSFYFTCHKDIVEKYKQFKNVNLIEVLN